MQTVQNPYVKDYVSMNRVTWESFGEYVISRIFSAVEEIFEEAIDYLNKFLIKLFRRINVLRSSSS